MLAIKGFASNSAFTNNTPGAIHRIGEVSTQSLSFSRERGMYIAPTLSNITFHALTTMQDDVKIQLDVPTRDFVLAVITEVYAKSRTGQELYVDTLINDLLTKFQTQGYQFNCGTIVNDGTYHIPTWVSFKINGKESFVKVWFTDQEFQLEYDEFEIVVVPPFKPVDDFFKHPTTVVSLIKSIKYTDMIEKVNEAKANNPEPIVRAEAFDYVNPLNSTDRTPTNWTVLIYGPNGDNIDSIKDALIDYILSNSAHGRDEWIKILPDLFRRTEFLLLPHWTKYAIENRQIEAGIHSPVTNLKAGLQWVTDNAFNYAPAHIAQYADFFSHPYKSLGIGLIGSIENRDNKYSIIDIYPDYINVNTASTDFNRMSAPTRLWAETIFEMLILADTANQYTSLPRKYTKVQRDGKWFVVRTVDNIHYLVSMRSNYPD